MSDSFVRTVAARVDRVLGRYASRGAAMDAPRIVQPLHPGEARLQILLQEIESGLREESKILLGEINRSPERADGLQQEGIWSRYSSNALYRLVLGASAFGYGKPQVAAMHFLHAVDLSDRNPLAIHCLARCYSAMGQDRHAIDVLRRGLQRRPDDVVLGVEACTALFRMGETDAANELFHPFAPRFEKDREAAGTLSKELQAAMEGDLRERSSDGDLYDDKFVTDLWWDYNACFTRFNEYQEGSAFMSHLIQADVGQGLSGSAGVIDFGVMCGFPNLCLAQDFPEIPHYGVDRQALIKNLNDKVYERENIRFVAGDIFDFLNDGSRDWSGFTLFHARTATVCYPAVVRDLYKACRSHNIAQIVAIEFGGLSKETLEFTDFRGPRSVALRSNMFIHPYETLLEEAGYRIESSRRRGKFGLFLDVGLGEATISTVARLS